MKSNTQGDQNITQNNPKHHHIIITNLRRARQARLAVISNIRVIVRSQSSAEKLCYISDKK
jgi:hypothetical protein